MRKQGDSKRLCTVGVERLTLYARAPWPCALCSNTAPVSLFVVESIKIKARPLGSQVNRVSAVCVTLSTAVRYAAGRWYST